MLTDLLPRGDESSSQDARAGGAVCWKKSKQGSKSSKRDSGCGKSIGRGRGSV
jgi:hypothetical protein